MIKFIFFLMYKYYSKEGSKSKDIAYISAVGLFLVIIFFSLIDIFFFFNFSVLNYIQLPDDKIQRYLYIILGALVPGYILCRIFLKEEEIKGLKYDEKKIKRGNLILSIYFAVSLIVFFVLALHRKGKL